MFAESPTLFVVDAASGEVSATPSVSVPDKTSPVFSSDSSTLYFTSADSTAGGIFALDTRSLAVRRILDRNRLGFRSDDSLKMFGYLLATAPDRGELFDGSGMVHDRPHGFPESTQRIVAIDPASGEVTSASPAMSIMSLTTLPAGPVAPKGALIILPLDSPRARESLGSLALFDPDSRTVIGTFSIPKYMPGTEPSATKPYATELERRVIPSPDGHRIYVLAWNTVYGFDLLTRRLFGVIHASSYDGRIAISPDGARVYFVEDKFDPGLKIVSRAQIAPRMPWIEPPSRIRVYDANLVEGPSIPFGVQFTPDSPTTRPTWIVVSRDNATLYLAANRRDAKGMAALHIVMMSVATGTIVRDISLGIRGAGTILVGH